MKWLLFLICLCIVGCATVTPDSAMADRPSPDTSTPLRYLSTVTEFNGGFLGYESVDGRRCGILTTNGRDAYNVSIDKYKIQFQDEYGVLLSNDLGVNPYIDKYNNQELSGKSYKLYSIDKQRLKYFMTLQQWARDKRDGDSIWIKFKNKIIP